jgi:alkyl hydroperoxide reductase subunit AhpF
MSLLSEQDAIEVRERLKPMIAPVRLVHFTQELNLEYGRETRELLEELAGLSSQLSLEVHNFQLEKEKAAEYGVDTVPATVVRDGYDRDHGHGIRFLGLPAGYEFASLLDAILMVSKGDSGLSPDSRKKLASVSQPVHLQVFVTPT